MVLAFIGNARRNIPYGDLSSPEEAKVKKYYKQCLNLIVNNQYEAYIPTFVLCNTYDKYSSLLPEALKNHELATHGSFCMLSGKMYVLLSALHIFLSIILECPIANTPSNKLLSTPIP